MPGGTGLRRHFLFKVVRQFFSIGSSFVGLVIQKGLLVLGSSLSYAIRGSLRTGKTYPGHCRQTVTARPSTRRAWAAGRPAAAKKLGPGAQLVCSSWRRMCGWPAGCQSGEVCCVDTTLVSASALPPVRRMAMAEVPDTQAVPLVLSNVASSA